LFMDISNMKRPGDVEHYSADAELPKSATLPQLGAGWNAA